MNEGKGKGKVLPRTGHEGPEGEYRYSSTLSLTLALDGGVCSTPRPGRFTPWKETRYPLYRRLGGPQGRSGRLRKISPPPVFFFVCPGFFPFDPFLYCFKSFRPSCHFTFHATVLTSNTTQTSMPPVGFEPTILVSERPKTHDLDRAATGIGDNNFTTTKLKHQNDAGKNNAVEEQTLTPKTRLWHLETPDVGKIAPNASLKAGELFPGTTGFMIAIQDQVISNNNCKNCIFEGSEHY
jgi:hypothetical protein